MYVDDYYTIVQYLVSKRVETMTHGEKKTFLSHVHDAK